MRSLRVFVILGIIALIPVVPFVLLGYSGNDYEFHLSSWMEMKNAWLHWTITPGWAALANFGLGEPRFCFYPPVSIWLGAFLSFFLPWRIVPGTFVWLTIFLGSLCMYFASARFVKEQDRLKASVLYAVSPYLLMTAIHRFAAAELCVLAILPMLLSLYFRTVWRTNRGSIALFGLILGLVGCTNVPAAVMLAYTLFLGCMVAACINRSWNPILYYFAAGFIGTSIAVFSLLPPLFEQDWISVNNLYAVDYHEFFFLASLSTQTNPAFRVALWLIAINGFLLVLICALRRNSRFGLSDWMFFTLASAVFLMQLPWSSPAWQQLPELRLVQFPYRFLSLLGVCVPLLLLSPRTKISHRKLGYVVLGATALLPFGGYLRHGLGFDQSKHPNFAEYFDSIRSGYPGMAEYVPIGGSRAVQPLEIAADSATAPTSSNCKVVPILRDSLYQEFSTVATITCEVRLNRFYYPFWSATDETGASLAITKDSKDLLIVTVPPGQHNVRVRFYAVSRLRVLAGTSSGLSMILVLGLLLLNRYRNISRNNGGGNNAFESATSTVRLTWARLSKRSIMTSSYR